MSTLRNLNLNLELGQTILVGQNREPAQITKIEFHEKSGEIDINTTKGPRKVLSFALAPSSDKDSLHMAPGDSARASADRYR